MALDLKIYCEHYSLVISEGILKMGNTNDGDVNNPCWKHVFSPNLGAFMMWSNLKFLSILGKAVHFCSLGFIPYLYMRLIQKIAPP